MGDDRRRPDLIALIRVPDAATIRQFLESAEYRAQARHRNEAFVELHSYIAADLLELHPTRTRVMRERAAIVGNGARLRRIPAGPERDELMPLLLLADDSESQVRSYYQQGELFAVRGDDGIVIGITLAIPTAGGGVEVKAVAVTPALQGRGVGQRMMKMVLTELRAAGVRQVTVGTSSSGIGQLAFYQKVGFRLSKIERDFFSPARGYPEGTTENGILLRDLVWMDLAL